MELGTISQKEQRYYYNFFTGNNYLAKDITQYINSYYYNKSLQNLNLNSNIGGSDDVQKRYRGLPYMSKGCRRKFLINFRRIYRWHIGVLTA